MRLLALALFLTLAACGRPLSTGEKSFINQIYGPSFAAERARLHNGALVGSVTFKRKKRPRLTCRERIFPERPEEIVTTSPAAVALFNHVFFAKPFFLKDYMHGYPDSMSLYAAMLFAHEATHIWQWQNRATTGYHPLKAAAEHSAVDDPYLFEIETENRFLDYPYEQQASLVEEYVCCTSLDPEAPRTKRLQSMLSEAFPLGNIHIPQKVSLPWDGAETDRICR
ncbi:hypothetical protein [Lentibacter sp. XHP0401]|uniref:hypothetical protein n=1 Tax=Lentibacter sp. XHP0401 TaxID=2984334 RepID=UPI0021E77E9B|nr:hypothetical protein [Lentibacter sp. XHP0401]MCV2893310.1 hypothetical protein [Lentibacter sp. XHP0401]